MPAVFFWLPTVFFWLSAVCFVCRRSFSGCRRAVARYSAHKLSLPSTKSWFLCAFCLQDPRYLAFRAQNRGFCAFLAFRTLVFGLSEHKIVVFVLFWPSEPSFSGFPSTKSAFLCAFCLQDPRFLAFRAQNRHFCALLPASFFPIAPRPGDSLIRRRYGGGVSNRCRWADRFAMSEQMQSMERHS